MINLFRIVPIIVLKYFLIAFLVGTTGMLMNGCEKAETQDYVVWAADQNLNELYILNPDGEVLESMNMGTVAGAERPHMLWGTPPDPYVYSANSVSGNVTILDSRDLPPKN